MPPIVFIIIIACYFSGLLLISWYTSRNAGESAYFIGNKASPWYAVAFGMIGDSLSGVTFISVPGAVGTSQFSYFQLVLGYLFGYMIISEVLLPLYYRMNLTSIYSYLRERFGTYAEKTGSFYFLLSRTLGAAARLYLAAGVIQIFIFDQLGIPFWVSVTGTIALILIYTLRGGIKTLVWTDTFQSLFLLLGVVLSIVAIVNQLEISPSEIWSKISGSGQNGSGGHFTQIFFWDWKLKSFFPKQFIGGVFIAVAMTGLDQNMMQKNLSMKTLGEARKNIRWFSIVLILVNFFFLLLGALLYLYSSEKGISVPVNEVGKPLADHLFPTLALHYLGPFAAVVFILGLTAATFSSADSVLTTLTTSFYIDFLHGNEEQGKTVETRKHLRQLIHILFAFILLVVILIFRAVNSDAVIDTVLTIAGYTYGPLLGLFSFGILTKRNARDAVTPLICIAAPLICYVLSLNASNWFAGYMIGHELLLLNGLITFAGLWFFSKPSLRQI